MPCQRDYTTWMIHISLCFPHVTIRVRRAHMLPTSSRPSNNCMRQGGDFRRDKNECRIANLSSHRINSRSISLYFFFLHHFWGGGIRNLFFLVFLSSLYFALSLFLSLLIHFLFPITPSPPPSLFLFPFFLSSCGQIIFFSPPVTVIFKFRQDIH